MTTNMIYSNLDVNQEGYYYRDYTATDGMYYYIEFRIVIKVGNPTDTSVTPQEHIQYNYNSTWKDQLESYGEVEYINGVPQTQEVLQEYTYDAQGNPTYIKNFFYNGTIYYGAYLSWNGRELMYITIMAGSSSPAYQIRYKYNDQGYRIQKEFYTFSYYTPTLTETIEYTLIGDKVIYETNGTYAIIYTYDYDGTLIGFSYDPNVNISSNEEDYFYLRNQLGDISHIISANGTTVVHYVYDAYGNIIKTKMTSGYEHIAAINSYTYRGYRYDSEIGMYYLNSRYYNPEIGRFISSDGLLGVFGDIQSTNMYAYCQNNPVMYTDITGHAPEWLYNYWKWVADGYKSIGRSISEEFVVDLSFGIPIIPGFSVKLGISIVVNLEDEYLEFYPHIGPSFGYSKGPAVSLGVLENYNNPGDYRKWFEYTEGGYWVGGGHCYGVDEDLKYTNAVKAYYVEFSSPNISYGRDYYYWNENLIIDWGN
jgi:RHS repeat-associated protein